MTSIIINFMYILLSRGMANFSHAQFKIGLSKNWPVYCALLVYIKDYLAVHTWSANMASFRCYATPNLRNAHALILPDRE